LAQVAKNIWLDRMIFIWHWEEKTGWREKSTILADSFEAFVWYLYIDMWEEVVYNFIKKVLFEPYVDKIDVQSLKSKKSQLQEYVQKNFKIVPEYKDYEYEKDNKWNILIFKSEVYVNWEKWWEWYWSNKKKAQEEAAAQALQNKVYNQ